MGLDRCLVKKATPHWGVCRDNPNKRQYFHQTLFARVSVCTSMGKKESGTKCLHEILKIVPLL